MQWLIIKPTSIEAETAAYALLDKKQELDEFSPGDWSKIKDVSKGKRVILLVPTEEVILNRVNIPASNQKLLAKAVPYALEDSLADDIENMHFSYHRASPEANVNVAAINKDHLQGWMDALRSRNLTAHIVLPDVFMLPVKDQSSAALLVQSNRALYRDDALTGFTTEPALLPILLSGALEKSEKTTLLLDSIDEPPQGLPEDISIEEAHGMNRQCHSSLLNALPLNLLNNFQQKGQKSLLSSISEWKNVAMLVATIGIVWIAMTAYENHRLQQQVDQLDSAIAQVFADTFPDARVDSDYRINHAAMAEKLEAIAPGASKLASSPLAPLASISSKLLEHKNIKLSRLQYDQSGLNLAVTAPSLSELEKFRSAIDQKNIDAEIVSSSTSSDSVEATVRIKEEAQ